MEPPTIQTEHRENQEKEQPTVEIEPQVRTSLDSEGSVESRDVHPALNAISACSFRGGGIKDCLAHWRELTFDKRILDLVDGISLEF